jgi:sugar (pentulose or hexulose) kinase
MTEKALLVDLGASRSKSIVVDNKTLVIDSMHTTAGSAISGDTIPMHSFTSTLEAHLAEAFKKYGVISKIILATEMHGYVSCNSHSPELSPYNSWRVSHPSDKYVIKLLSASTFQNSTGLRPRSGLPIVHILATHMHQESVPAREILFLPQAICRLMGKDNGNVHLSLAQSSGLYELNGNPAEIDKVKDLALPLASKDDAIELGEIQYGSHSIPVYGGYGDLQTSVYGVSPKTEQWIINLGTGSQVAIRSNSNLSGFEKRPYFNKEMLQAVTHLPAGRALNVFASLFAEIRGEKSHDHFWRELEAIKEFKEAPMSSIDMNVFQQARHFETGGKIEGILEEQFSMHQLLLSLVYGIVKNYTDVIKQSGIKSNLPILLSGRMGEKIALFPAVIERMNENKVMIQHDEIDSSLLGLRRVYIENILK